jgi:hypothetical protein
VVSSLSKNIYENFKDVLIVNDLNDVTAPFLEKAKNTVLTVGVIATKELAECIAIEALKTSWVSSLKIELDLEDEESNDDREYMVSINPDGNLALQPVEFYNDECFRDMYYTYILMDGSVSQVTIDACLTYGMEVTLFGYDE